MADSVVLVTFLVNHTVGQQKVSRYWFLTNHTQYVTNFCWHFVIKILLSCVISEVKLNTGWKLPILPVPALFSALFGVTPMEFHHVLWCEKTVGSFEHDRQMDRVRWMELLWQYHTVHSSAMLMRDNCVWWMPVWFSLWEYKTQRFHRIMLIAVYVQCNLQKHKLIVITNCSVWSKHLNLWHILKNCLYLYHTMTWTHMVCLHVQMIIFFVGIALLIFSFVAVYFIERNSAILFSTEAT